jgi:hypothetical protein
VFLTYLLAIPVAEKKLDEFIKMHFKLIDFKASG